MLNWIKGYTDRWTGAVGTEVRDLVHWGLHALAGVVYGVFGHVGKAWGELLAGLQWMHGQADQYVSWTLTHLHQLVIVDIPRLAGDALAGLQRALAWATSLYKLALAGLDRLRADAQQWVRDALKWVQVNVYDPLLARIRQAESDLLKWGFYAYDLLTHPDRLAGLLIGPLVAAAEAAFWTLAGPLGTFALRLIVANTARLLALFEAIVMAVL